MYVVQTSVVHAWTSLGKTNQQVNLRLSKKALKLQKHESNQASGHFPNSDRARRAKFSFRFLVSRELKRDKGIGQY